MAFKLGEKLIHVIVVLFVPEGGEVIMILAREVLGRDLICVGLFEEIIRDICLHKTKSFSHSCN